MIDPFIALDGLTDEEFSPGAFIPPPTFDQEASQTPITLDAMPYTPPLPVSVALDRRLAPDTVSAMQRGVVPANGHREKASIVVVDNGSRGTAQALARAAFESLVNHGQILAGVSPDVLGDYGEPYSELVRAFEQGGRPAAQRVYNALTKAVPRLGALLSEPPHSVLTRTTWTAQELLEAEFPEPEWAIPGILPVGLNSLAGRPKLGKSWLGLQIAHTVGTGGYVFGQRVEHGKVICLTLEDSPRRLQDRLRKQGVPSRAGIVFHTSWPTFRDGGIEDLIATIRSEEYRLAIVDTLSRAIRGAKQDDLDQMTILLGELQSQAQQSGVGVLLIDHHRKPGGTNPDPVDDIIGSTAKSAVFDTILGLYRERGKRDATLHIVGRDVEERTIDLSFDPVLCTWEPNDQAGKPQPGSRKGRIMEAIRELQAGGNLPTTTAIAGLTGIDKGNVSSDLLALVDEELVEKGEKRGREQPYWPVVSSALKD